MERLHIIIRAPLYLIHRHLKIILLLIKRVYKILLIKQIVRPIKQSIRIKQVTQHQIVPKIVPQTPQPYKTQQLTVLNQILHQMLVLQQIQHQQIVRKQTVLLLIVHQQIVL